MVDRPEILAIIPARGGSKSVPRKNIKLLAGFPLIAYSIAAGLQAKTVTRTLVSTDDHEIAEIARHWGAEVPFMRPANLAQDDTPDLPVFEHTLDWLARHEGYVPKIVVQLRPTSPIRPLTCVDDAVCLLLDHPEADSVRGIVPSGENPFKMWFVNEDGTMRPILDVGLKESYNAPRQQLPPTYWHAGHIDVMWVRIISEKRSLSGEKIYPLLIEEGYTVDIDTPHDWDRAEWMIHHIELPFVRPEPGSH